MEDLYGFISSADSIIDLPVGKEGEENGEDGEAQESTPEEGDEEAAKKKAYVWLIERCNTTNLWHGTLAFSWSIII